MNDPSFLALVQNIALLLALVLFFDIILVEDYIHVFPFRQISTGVLIGAIGVAVMLTPWVLAPGAIFDTRSVLLSMSGLFFGAIPTLVAMAITAAFRIYQGGSGALTGVVVILATGSIGIIWRQLRKQPLDNITWKELYLFGVFTHLVMLALMLTLPWEIALHVLTNISLPVLIINPLGTALLGILIINRQRREKIQEALTQYTTRLNATQKLAKMGGWEWDKVRQSMFWSDETYRIHGFSPEEIPPGSTEHIDRSILCYEPYARPIIQAAFQDCFEKGLPYSIEVPFTNILGERMWVCTQAEAVRENDKIVRVVGNIIDITARKLAEEAINESEMQFRIVFEKTSVGYTLTSLEGLFLRVNQAFANMLGYTVDEMVGKNWADFTLAEDIQKSHDILVPLLAGGQNSTAFEKRYLRKDGIYVDVIISTTLLRDAQNAPMYFITNILDISERKKSEEALRESEERYQSITEHLTEMLFIHDLQGKILEVNWAAASEMGYTRAELQGMTVFDLHATHEDEYAIEEVQQLWMAWTAGNRITLEREHRRKDGSVFPVEINTSKIILDGSEIMIATVQDITARKTTEEKIREDQVELQRLLAETEHSRQALLSVVEDQKEAQEQVRQLNAELEQRVQDRTAQLNAVNQELEAFSYSVSHDLRAPLRALDGFSGALISDYQETLDQKGLHYLTRIQEASHRMGQLIEDLLNLSRITRREINLDHVDLSLLARQIAGDLHSQTPERQVEFEISPDLVVRADSGLIKIAMENLLHNALKYSSKKETALIQVGVLDQSGSDGRVYFVRDNGAGFDMAYADKLFTPFQRLHGTQEFSGTGIGLTIVQRIIARHGGRIWPEAAVNLGATFYFTLGVNGDPDPMNQAARQE